MYKIYFIAAIAAFVYFGSYTDFFEIVLEMQQTIGDWLLVVIIAILLFRKKQ